MKKQPSGCFFCAMLTHSMYSQHFGLTQDPFSIAPDPRYLFMSERHREALAHLLFGVAGARTGAGGTGGGFVLLTGDIGTGKTTICRCFLEQIPSGCHVAYIFNPKLTVPELLQSICEEFHIAVGVSTSSAPTVKEYIDRLNAFLLQSHAAGESSVLIIDEAQNLQPDVLEQLRLLTNLETNARKLLQIVLIGQPELRAMLERADLEQLAQRVIARFHLDALTEGESAYYIQHRLAVAGHNGPSPFERAALQRIHRLARGVPRRINLLCGRALLGAWATGQHKVSRAVVDKAATEVFGSEAAYAQGTGWTKTVIGSMSVLLGATVAGLAMFAWQTASHPRTPSATQAAPAMASAVLPRPASPGVSSAPASSASGPAAAAGAGVSAVPAPAARPVMEPLDAVLPQLPQDMNLAWADLAQVWRLPGSLESPCDAALAQELQCYRASKLSMPLLRQLGRPGILTLQSEQSPARYAVLVGMSEQNAALRTATGLHTVSLIALGRVWHGEFATLWHAPKGYSPAMRGGSTGPAILELTRQLAVLDGVPAPAPSAVPMVLDAELRDRVRDFQNAHGLQADGLPGPITFMQLESATGAPHPRLLTEPH
jgi:general secretion pathway protein A